jgi:hypothetical protein
MDSFETSIAAMQSQSGGPISCSGFFGGLEVPQVDAATINTDPRTPYSQILPEMHSLEAAPVIPPASGIPSVLLIGSNTKIASPVVECRTRISMVTFSSIPRLEAENNAVHLNERAVRLGVIVPDSIEALGVGIPDRKPLVLTQRLEIFDVNLRKLTLRKWNQAVRFIRGCLHCALPKA